MARTTPEEQAANEGLAYKTHITKKIRGEWGQSVPADATDDEVLGVWADLNVPPDATQEDIDEVINETYGSDYLPPKMEDRRTFGEKAADVGSAIVPAVAPIAANIGAAFSAAVPAMGKVAGALGKSVPAQLGMAGYYGTKLAGAQLAGSQLEKTAAGIPEPNIADLRARGYSDQQIRNIVKGYTDTQHSLMGDVQAMGKEGTSTATEALANAAVLPMGANALEKVVQGVGGQAAALGGLGAAVGQTVGKIAGRAVGGSILGGVFGGTAKVAEKATEAVENGGNASQVLHYMSGGLLGDAPSVGEGSTTDKATNPFADFGKGFGETWKFGAAFGGAIGAVEGAAAGARGIAASKALRKLEANKKARTLSVERFGEEFKPDDLVQKFDTDLKEADAQGLTDVALATNIVTKLHPDMVSQEAGLKTIALISEKIKPWRVWKSKLEGTDLPVEATQPFVQPIPEGAPEGFVPEGPAPMPGAVAQDPGLITPGMAVRATPPERQPAALAGPFVQAEPTGAGFVPPGSVTREGALQPPIESPPVAPSAGPIVPEAAPVVGTPAQLPTVEQGPVAGQAPLPNMFDQGPIGVAENRAFTPPEVVPPRAEGIEYGKLPVEEVEHALAAIKRTPPKGVKMEIAPSESGDYLELKSLAGIEEKSSGPALKQLARQADEYGMAVQARLVPQSGPKGGRIPVEKLKKWYEEQGFKVIEEGEGYAVVRREPLGAHQADMVERLDRIAAAAQRRIDSRVGRLQAGFDPADFRDHALVLAADMFSKRLRSKAAIETWAVEKWGEEIKPHLAKIVELAQKHFVRMFKAPGTADKNLKTLLELGTSGTHGANWYEGTANWARKNFGEDADMMLRFLAVTSANGQTESGAAMALKAFAQWKAGMPFEGFRGESMVGQLKRAAEGTQIGGTHSKIENFYQALKGDPDAIVLDRWMLDALNLKEKGGALRENDYRIYAQVIDDLAEMNGMTPRQFQAAVWEGARVRKAHMTEKKGGRALTTKSGSARPLEELVDRKLAGMSIDEYIEANHGNLKEMERLYQALAPVRHGEAFGYTFNPKTWETDTKGGFLTSLASNVVDRKQLYPAEIVKFRKQIEPILKANPGRHFTIGVFKMDDGNYSIDLNMTVPNQDEAVKLAFKNRQYEVGNLAEGGEYLGGIPTGYDPKKHGPQFVPPDDPAKRPAWLRNRVKQINASLRGGDLFEE